MLSRTDCRSSPNAVQYHTLLDIPRVKQVGYSLSTCFLAVYLVNEKVLSNSIKNQSANTEEALENRINKLLERYALSFDPQCDRSRLPFTDEHCRFDPVELTTHGSQTIRWLWEFGDSVMFSERVRDENAMYSIAMSSSFMGGHWIYEYYCRCSKVLNSMCL